MADIVSERYAQSLYEVAKDEKQEKEYLEELTAVCGAFRENPDFLKLLTTPSIAFEDKQNVLKTVFEGKIRPFVLNFLMLTTEKGRIGLIHEMREAYKEQYYFENNIAEVCAVTAVPMSDALRDRLKNKMQAVTGRAGRARNVGRSRDHRRHRCQGEQRAVRHEPAHSPQRDRRTADQYHCVRK